MRYQVIMIGGMPRSGTTVISNYIQSKLYIPISPETHYFSAGITDDNRVRVSRLPRPVTENPVLGPIYKKLNGEIEKNPYDGFERLLHEIFGNKFDVVGEKTPRHLMSFRKIAENRSGYKFIVMHRSCLDICSSLKNVPWNDGDNLKNSLRWFKYYLEEVKLVGCFPGRVVTVKYERLCRDPERELTRIRNKLDIAELDQRTEEFINYDADLEPWKKRSDQKPAVRKRVNNIGIVARLALIVFEKIVDFAFSFVRFTNVIRGPRA